MNTVQIQGLGRVAAIKAEDLKVGMRRVYNYGIQNEVIAIEPKGKASLSLTTRGDNGATWTATIRRNSLVAVA
jgi:hypothetical protein